MCCFVEVCTVLIRKLRGRSAKLQFSVFRSKIEFGHDHLVRKIRPDVLELNRIHCTCHTGHIKTGSNHLRSGLYCHTSCEHQICSWFACNYMHSCECIRACDLTIAPYILIVSALRIETSYWLLVVHMACARPWQLSFYGAVHTCNLVALARLCAYCKITVLI